METPSASPRVVELDRAVDWIGQDRPAVIVVGAGLSMDSPSDAPGVAPFLETTIDLLLTAVYGQPSDPADPTTAVYQETRQSLVGRLLPEACYGTIAQVFASSKHLEMWGALGPAAARRAGAAPNAGHRMVAHLGATRGWPVITTNFDCFIEAAADELGIPVDTIVPGVEDQVDLSIRPGHLTLLKLHGSTIDTPDDARTGRVRRIRSTVADLSRCARIVRRAILSEQPERMLVIGYSGRDLDLFPWLASRFADPDSVVSERVLWVDPTFARPQSDWKGHRVHAVGHTALALGVGARDLAEALGFSAPLDDHDSSRWSDFRRIAVADVESNVRPLVSSSVPNAAAVLAGTLSSIGSHTQIVELASSLVPT